MKKFPFLITLLLSFSALYAKPFDDSFWVTTYKANLSKFNIPIRFSFDKLESNGIKITINPAYEEKSFTIKPDDDHIKFFSIEFPDNIKDIPLNTPLFKITISTNDEKSFNTYYLGFMQVHSPTPLHELLKFVFYDGVDNPKQAHNIYMQKSNVDKHYFDIPVYFDRMEANNMATDVIAH